MINRPKAKAERILITPYRTSPDHVRRATSGGNSSGLRLTTWLGRGRPISSLDLRVGPRGCLRLFGRHAIVDSPAAWTAVEIEECRNPNFEALLVLDDADNCVGHTPRYGIGGGAFTLSPPRGHLSLKQFSLEIPIGRTDILA